MKRSDSEQRKKILAAAVPVFAGHGLKGATTRLIGKAAGVNSALIYYYFDDKETLFVEAVRQVLGEFLTLLRDRQTSFRSPRERIRFLVDGLTDYFSRWPDRMRLMTRVVAFHPNLMGEALTSVFRERQGLVPLQVILEGVMKGEFRPLAPIQMWWAIVGICMFALYARDVVGHVDKSVIPFAVPDFEERKNQIVELLAHGIAVEPGGASRRKKGGGKA